MRRHTILSMLLVPVLAACSSGTKDTTGTTTAGQAATSAISSTSATTPALPTVTDGVYAKTSTKRQAVADGISDPGLLGAFGSDGKLTILLKFAGGSWAQFSSADGGAPELGDGGDLHYNDDGTVTTISRSDGCPGCRYTYAWDATGSSLTLTMVSHQSDEPPEDVAIVRFITEGTFEQQS